VSLAETVRWPVIPNGRTSVVVVLDRAIRARVTGISWRRGCPVALDDLRIVMVTYRGFDGDDHVGPLIVHRSVASNVASVFDELYEAKFPIRTIALVDDFGADDDRSTLADNTSGFNCRRVAGAKHWSQHAYGKAVDINPLENPYVYADGHVLDAAARPFLDRKDARPGMITADGPVVAAFARVGWDWGGSWRTTKDYQHFSSSGR
jgi:D-alanyl-D-alanine carboxypeptidase